MFEAFQTDPKYISELSNEKIESCGPIVKLSAATPGNAKPFVHYWEIYESDGFTTRQWEEQPFGEIAFPSNDRGNIRLFIEMNAGERLAIWITACAGALYGDFEFTSHNLITDVEVSDISILDDRSQKLLIVTPESDGKSDIVNFDMSLIDVSEHCPYKVWTLVSCDICKVF